MSKLRAGFYKLGAPYQNLPPGHAAILVPFGDDMKFQNAMKQYSNMDALMQIINSNPDYGVNVVYLLRGRCIHYKSHSLPLILGLNSAYIFPGVGMVR